jgi:hypothetical protein
MGSVTASPVSRRADELVVGDHIDPKHLPFATEPGEALLVRLHDYRGGSWVFVAWVQGDGYHDSTSFLPDAEVLVEPAGPIGHDYSREPDDPTPVSPARVPLHTGAMTDCGLVDESEPPVHLEVPGAKTLCGLAIIGLPTGVGWTNDHAAITCRSCLDGLPF